MANFDVLYDQVWDLLVEFELLQDVGLQPSWCDLDDHRSAHNEPA